MSPHRTTPGYRRGRFGYRPARCAATSRPAPALLAAAADEPAARTWQLPQAQPGPRQQAA